MSTRRATRTKRCPTCMVHQDNCYCSEVKRISLATKVSLILFKKEKFLTSNTATLSHNSLTNSQVFYRGYKDDLLQESFLDVENYHPLFLYPSEESVTLSDEFLKKIKKPINLIVPDGSWRQAKKVHKREPLLSGVTQIKLPTVPKSIYPLRRQKFDYGVCTHEAISFALGMIEGHQTQEVLMENFDTMIAAHLKYRAIFTKEE